MGRSRKVLAGIGSVLAGLAILVALYQAFWPVFSFSVAQPTDPRDPFSFPFIATNESVTPLFFVRVSCSYDLVEFDNGTTFSGNTVLATRTHSILAPKQQAPGRCHGYFREVSRSVRLKRAQVTVIAAYRVLGVFPTETTRTHHGDAVADGSIRWLPD
jgi:hypothetical protein